MTALEKLVADAAKAYEYYSEDELEEYANKVNTCPKCGSRNISHKHYDDDVIEVDYNQCTDCDFQWEVS